MVLKLTVDGGLLRDGIPLPAVRTLKRWEQEGRIEMFETDRAKGSFGVTPSKPHSRFRTQKKPAAGGASFQRVSSVIFPFRDPTRLNMTEINDVTHLMRHHALGHSVFVTNNAASFILDGRRERLQAMFQILVLTPDEAVMALEGDEQAKRVAHE